VTNCATSATDCRLIHLRPRLDSVRKAAAALDATDMKIVATAMKIEKANMRTASLEKMRVLNRVGERE